ncbi:MAG: protein kinase [Bdellovibrionales bacterium]|nr:protein kinase [Bdellovibrionales bacterium]
MDLIADKYEIVRKLGEGGTGKVYLVRHTDLNVEYALKLLHRSVSEDDRFIEAFKKEAALLLRFSHQGVTQLRDFGRTSEGQYYMAMDFSEGVPLKFRLEQDGYFSAEESLRITIQILDVLEAAHSQGIIHRDIKPENVMLEADREAAIQVKVLDFGTAVLKQQFSEDEVAALFGTPCYMSPEQAAGQTDSDHRVDLYSLGVVMYEMLTGEVPFEGENVVQTLLMHLTHPPLSLTQTFGVPEEIEKIVLKALQKEPNGRFQNAKEFRLACESALTALEKRESGESQMRALEANRATLLGVIPQPVKPVEDDGSTTILCLDDDEMVLNIMQHVLEREGYTVYTAVDCSAIHDYLFQKNVRLLVSDVQMPGLPGTKVCRLLKKSMQDLKIILFSNIPERDLERASNENMADGWISKLRKPNEWLAEIQRVLAQ